MQLLSTKSYCKNEKRKEKFIQNQMIRPQWICENLFSIAATIKKLK
jgi:hypothetical protein